MSFDPWPHRADLYASLAITSGPAAAAPTPTHRAPARPSPQPIASPPKARKAAPPIKPPKVVKVKSAAVELALMEIAGHLTFTAHAVTAWYWVPEVRWAFRPDGATPTRFRHR
jgi:hypothetical protein